jgi:hypothetical protein
MAARAHGNFTVSQLTGFSVVALEVRSAEIQVAVRALLDDRKQKGGGDLTDSVTAVATRAGGRVGPALLQVLAVDTLIIDSGHSLVALTARLGNVQWSQLAHGISQWKHGVVPVAIGARRRE